MTVTYPRGQYTLKMLDHVTVYVVSKVSHAHGLSLSLQLLHCGPAALHSDGMPAGEGGGDPAKTDARREVVKVRDGISIQHCCLTLRIMDTFGTKHFVLCRGCPLSEVISTRVH